MKVLQIALLSAVVVVGVFSKDESVKHGTPTKNDHYKDGKHEDDYDHEAVLGSEDDVEEYSHLSPEEAKERLRKLIVKSDVNGDGHIDMEELVKWILNSFSSLNLEDTKDRLEVDDKNADGFVTWEEFTESTYGMSEEELAELQETGGESENAQKKMAKSLKLDKKKFQAADENGDGKLSLEEAVAFLHPYDYSRMSEVETDRVLDEFDTNGDGKIDVKEYLSNAAFANKDEEDKIAEKENFLYFDEDKDETLNKAEILKWVSPELEKVADEEAQHLMSETDKNKDGQLSAQEILDEHELWVGSEATGYGDHDEL